MRQKIAATVKLNRPVVILFMHKCMSGKCYKRTVADDLAIDNLCELIEQSGRSQADVAKALGMNQSNVSRLLDGSIASLKQSTLERAASYFRVPFSYFGSKNRSDAELYGAPEWRQVIGFLQQLKPSPALTELSVVLLISQATCQRFLNAPRRFKERIEGALKAQHLHGHYRVTRDGKDALGNNRIRIRQL